MGEGQNDDVLVDKIDCDEGCEIPPGVRLVRVPRPRHAWRDVLVCPHCGDAFFRLPSPSGDE